MTDDGKPEVSGNETYEVFEVPVWERERAAEILAGRRTGTPNLLSTSRRAQLVFVNDADPPTHYALDQIASEALDQIRAHPEATLDLTMPTRDRLIAAALLRMALDVLDPGP